MMVLWDQAMSFIGYGCGKGIKLVNVLFFMFDFEAT